MIDQETIWPSAGATNGFFVLPIEVWNPVTLASTRQSSGQLALTDSAAPRTVAWPLAAAGVMRQEGRGDQDHSLHVLGSLGSLGSAGSFGSFFGDLGALAAGFLTTVAE